MPRTCQSVLEPAVPVEDPAADTADTKRVAQALPGVSDRRSTTTYSSTSTSAPNPSACVITVLVTGLAVRCAVRGGRGL